MSQSATFLSKMNSLSPLSNEGRNRGLPQSRSITIKPSPPDKNRMFQDSVESLLSREMHYTEATWRMYYRIAQHRQYHATTTSSGSSIAVADTDPPSYASNYSARLGAEREGMQLEDDHSVGEDIFHLEL